MQTYSLVSKPILKIKKKIWCLQMTSFFLNQTVKPTFIRFLRPNISKIQKKILRIEHFKSLRQIKALAFYAKLKKFRASNLPNYIFPKLDSLTETFPKTTIGLFHLCKTLCKLHFANDQYLQVINSNKFITVT